MGDRPGGDLPAPSGPARLWAVGQRGFPAHYPVVQFPNAPLLISLIASVVHGQAHGDVADYAWAISRVGLAIWAYEELVRGDNAFRRVLGVVGLVLVVRGLAVR